MNVAHAFVSELRYEVNYEKIDQVLKSNSNSFTLEVWHIS